DGEPGPIDVAALRTGSPEHDAVLEVVAAATAYDAAQRPSATELLAHPALRALVARWDDPALADRLEVVDEYPAAPDPTPSRATMAYPPPPPPPSTPVPTAAATAAVTTYGAPVTAKRPVDAFVLLGVGVLGLVVALLLLLG
ncbi:hypothetical protein ACFFOS_23415, partial [Nocardioides kongjuensis]